jgi:hypothetical protein
LTAGAALVGIAGMATLFGVASDLLVRQQGGPLRFQTLSNTQLHQMGISLVTASPPPYCLAAIRVEEPGWVRDRMDCPISRDQAQDEADVRGGGETAAVESALARTTIADDWSALARRLVWAVVISSRRPGAEASRPAGCQANAAPPLRCDHKPTPRVVIIDATVGGLLYEAGEGYRQRYQEGPRPVDAGLSAVARRRAVAGMGSAPDSHLPRLAGLIDNARANCSRSRPER